MIGDLGARILLYYASLENQWLLLYQISFALEGRKVIWQDYGVHVTSQFYGQPVTHLQSWQDTLHRLITSAG